MYQTRNRRCDDDDSYEGIEYNDVSCLCIDPIPDKVISNATVKMIDLKKQFMEDSDNSGKTIDIQDNGPTYSEPGLPIDEPPKKRIKLEQQESESDLTGSNDDEDESTYMSNDGAVFSVAAPPGPSYNIVYHTPDTSSLISMIYKDASNSHGRSSQGT